MTINIEKPKVVVITGPTASGKSDVANSFVRKFGGEIVSCDSMQVYRHMDIGTAKPSKEQMRETRHHLVGYVDPDQEYSVYRFREDALIAIRDILARKAIPVLTGGTGLYINSLVFNIGFSGRQGHEKKEEGQLYDMSGEELHLMLQKLDPDAAGRIHPHNVKRVRRALEIRLQDKGHKYGSVFEAKQCIPYDYRIFALSLDRQKLYEKINKRTEAMFENGLVEETKKLLENNMITSRTALQAIGYKEAIQYLKGEISCEEAVGSVKKNTRNYAKRQLTWLRKIEGITWIDMDRSSSEEAAEQIGKDFFK